MKLKAAKPWWLPHTGSGSWRGWPFLWLIAWSLLLFAAGVAVHKYGLTWKAALLFQDRYQTAKQESGRFVRRLSVNPERLILDIGHKAYKKLEYKRKTALQQGVLIASSDDFVPAKIRYRDKTVKVRLRLKGDWTDHLKKDKWSFRVKVRGEHTLMGMKRFSLHAPRTRNGIYEWLFHQMLADEGVVALRYRFVDITLNGKSLGLYALEEHFGKRLLEANQRREGPIVRFSEALLWQDRRYYVKGDPLKNRAEVAEAGAYFRAPVDPFQSGRAAANPRLRKQHDRAIALLAGFRQGRLHTGEVFDLDLLARFYAVSDLTGAFHGTIWHNLRYYHNPVTDRLEPIGFDAQPGESTSLLAAANAHETHQTHLFAHLPFTRTFLHHLTRMSQPNYLNAFFARREAALQTNLALLRADVADAPFSRRRFYDNAEMIGKLLNPLATVFPFFAGREAGQVILDIGNALALPVEILQFTLTDGTVLSPAAPVILPRQSPQQPIRFQRVAFSGPSVAKMGDGSWQGGRVGHRIAGGSGLRWQAVQSEAPRLALVGTPRDSLRQPDNAADFDFLALDRSARLIAFRPGRWVMRKRMILPAGYRIMAGEGVDLDLADGAFILSRSPLQFVGSEEAPIRVHSSDGSGGGVVVLNAGGRSQLRHVHFNNLSGPTDGAAAGWALPGAVTFYQSPVTIAHCRIVASRSEDGLNILRSAFLISETLFEKNGSDALDTDFSHGEINQVIFLNAGNDAIDISGGRLTGAAVVIRGTGDKGLSGGEGGEITLKGVSIEKAAIAVASKDLSRVILQDLQISDAPLGFAVFQKKSEFGPAIVEVRGLKMVRVKTPYLLETASRLTLEGDSKTPTGDNIKDRLYGAEFGKSSR